MTPPTFSILNPFAGLDPVNAILSAIGHVFTAGAQSIATWAFDQMTQALVATTEVSQRGRWTPRPHQLL